MIQSLLVVLFSFSFIISAQAEFVAGENLGSDDSESVLETSYFADLSLEEPVFSSRKSQREIATFFKEDQGSTSEWQGQLSVVQEIPYSYPWISHNTLSLRVLNEIEAAELAGSTDSKSQ